MPGEQFADLVALMARLRAPDGCPWDRAQTFDSIKPYLLEETYEVVDAIDRRDFEELKSELGDLLLQVVFFSQMAAEQEHFTMDDVIQHIHTKMVRRHPHVFGDAEARTPGDVLRRWEELKAEEQRQQSGGHGESTSGATLLDGMARAMPALLEAYQLNSRASSVGFDWRRIEELLEKVGEERDELRQAVAEAEPELRRQRCQDEVGDLLFVAVNVARFLGLEPETALRRANDKFRRRFGWLEARLAERGKKPAESTLEEMDELWQRSKSEALR